MPMTAEPEMGTAAVKRSGMNVAFGDMMHCVAAEPHATFIRVGITNADSTQEVAFEVAVLGRLRHGYRIFQCRGPLGTRIELAYLFVRIQLGQVSHFWQSPRQVCVRAHIHSPTPLRSVSCTCTCTCKCMCMRMHEHACACMCMRLHKHHVRSTQDRSPANFLASCSCVSKAYTWTPRGTICSDSWKRRRSSPTKSSSCTTSSTC